MNYLKYIIRVNSNQIQRNKRDKTKEPTVVVGDGEINELVHEAEIVCPCCDKAVGKVVCDLDNPLPSGATVWIEAEKVNKKWEDG